MSRTSRILLFLICVCAVGVSQCQEHVGTENPLSHNTIRTRSDESSRYHSPPVNYDKMDENDRKQHYRKCNVIVDGIPRRENEDIMEVVEIIGRKLGFDYPLNVVTSAHRVRLFIADKPEPIVIRLRSPGVVEKWIREYRTRKLWREHWSMNEHLTKQNEQLLVAAKQWARRNGIRFVFTRGCVLYYQESSSHLPQQIKDQKHLAEIIQMHKERRMNQISSINQSYTTPDIHPTTHIDHSYTTPDIHSNVSSS